MVASLEEQTGFECFKSHKYISMLMRKSFVEYYHHSNEGNDDENDRTRKLEAFLSCLDEERVKIDAFKRQLPLSTQLLNSAVETSKQLLLSYKENREQKEKAMLKEFIPIAKQDVGCEEAENARHNVSSDNKANWMASAQLWCQSTSNDNKGSAMSSQDQTKGGAFSPFIKDQTSRVGCDLGLMVSTEKDMEDEKCFDNGGVVNEHVKTESTHNNTIAETRVTAIVTTSGDNNNTNNNNNNNNNNCSSSNNNSQAKRKERRCWSPELHRKFVNALQMLGGSQVATPKQIRELMKIDGLTNDEVKSHLQKYRLHTRRPNCLVQQTHQHQQQQQPQLVVLGGIWVPQEYANTYNGQPVSSHYFLPPPPTAHHHHHLFNNNSTATTVAAGTRMEFEGKANAVERSLESGEVGDEESNESEITLKI